MTKVDRMKILVRYVIRNGIAKNQKDLGRTLGYNNESYFSQILNEKTEMPKDFISKMTGIVPDLNPGWLMTGEGEMLRTSAPSVSVSSACCGPAVSVAGNISGSGNSVHGVVGDDSSLHTALLAELSAQRGLLTKAQEQMDRLISVIERLTGSAER